MKPGEEGLEDCIEVVHIASMYRSTCLMGAINLVLGHTVLGISAAKGTLSFPLLKIYLRTVMAQLLGETQCCDSAGMRIVLPIQHVKLLVWLILRTTRDRAGGAYIPTTG